MNRHAAILFTCLLLAACGQKGALYMPDQANPVVVPATPAPPAITPANGAEASPTDEEQRQRQQQQAAPGNNAGN